WLSLPGPESEFRLPADVRQGYANPGPRPLRPDRQRRGADVARGGRGGVRTAGRGGARGRCVLPLQPARTGRGLSAGGSVDGGPRAVRGPGAGGGGAPPGAPPHAAAPPPP